MRVIFLRFAPNVTRFIYRAKKQSRTYTPIGTPSKNYVRRIQRWNFIGETVVDFIAEKISRFLSDPTLDKHFRFLSLSLSRNRCVPDAKSSINEIKHFTERPILVPRTNGYRITSLSKNLQTAAITVDRHRSGRIVFREKSIENKPTYDGNEE